MLQINSIYCGDNVELCQQLDTNSINLTVTSPPYDNLRNYKSFNFDFEGLAKQLLRVTVEGGIVVWVVGDAVIKGSETGTSFKQALHFKEIGFSIHDTMIYEKSGIPYPSTTRYYQNYEYMFVLSKGTPNVINLIKDKPNANAGKPAHWGKMAFRQKDGSLKEVGENYITPEFGIRTNVWRYKTGGHNVTADKIAYQHPAIFPEALASDHILSWSNPGDLVFDPHNGSGTTTKMAKNLNRNYIGIDCSEEYCQIARERIRLMDEATTI